MNETTLTGTLAANKKKNDIPDINIEPPKRIYDGATIIGLFGTFGLILGAILIGQSNASFINTPALMIVLLGTIAATSISYTAEELKRAVSVMQKSVVRTEWDPALLAFNLIDVAVVAKKKGILVLSQYEREFQRSRFLHSAMQMVIDGYKPKNVSLLLGNEIEAYAEHTKRSVSVAERAAEIAPAMGLIGTLVGLVQMLSDLDSPEMLGPSMAVAILTTLYGAILGMVMMASIAVKLQKNADDEILTRTLIKTTAVSIAKQINPREIEMLLNAELPASQRIRYFD